MVVHAMVGMDQMGKIIDMLIGKEDEAFQNFCTILEQCGAEVWPESLKERARAFKKATGIHFCLHIHTTNYCIANHV